jgi:hypothetical protein
MSHKLIEAKTNGSTDYLLLIDDRVVSRWAELDSQDFGDLSDWDNQAAAGADLSDYQADLDAERYEVTMLCEQSVPEWMPDGEWFNGDCIEFSTPYRRTYGQAVDDVYDRLSMFTSAERSRIKWVGVRKFQDGIASAATLIDPTCC